MDTVLAVDAHMHLNDPKFSLAERRMVLLEMQQNHLFGVCSGWDYHSSAEALQIAEQNFNIYATAGLHPGYVDGAQIEALNKLTKFAGSRRVVAVGECGLDKCCRTEWALQIKALEIQLDLAESLQLPVVLHVRKAHEEMLKILSERRGSVCCMLHGCSASWEQVQRYLALGCMISFGGSITWRNSVKSVRSAQNTPIESILTETDSPYMAPENTAGGFNHPKNVLLVCKKISEVKALSNQNVLRASALNAQRFFNFKI